MFAASNPVLSPRPSSDCEMKIWNGLDDLPNEPGRTVISLGCFDGVHRGHQLLLARLTKVAATKGAKSVVVTFDPLPAQVLYPETAPVAIMALEDRLSALEAAGVDAVLVIKYTRDIASQPAEDFVAQAFVKSLHAAVVVVGEDCRFGRGRAGNIDTLKGAGLRWNFDVSVMSDRTAGGVGGRRYSSTWAREALSSGNVGIAEQILGRPHRIRMRATWAAGSWTTKVGSVRGMLPTSGDYAGWVRIGSAGTKASNYSHPRAGPARRRYCY
uniref:FAD synthase n=1 Tax=Arthrobacter sp. NyZ415 TaxID=683157 RepID=D0V0Z8_9MICC|nr:putative FMN adenylyltransferase [Arthrobacter sp. NyZ415]